MTNINLQIINECRSTNSSLIKLANEGHPEGHTGSDTLEPCATNSHLRCAQTLCRPLYRPHVGRAPHQIFSTRPVCLIAHTSASPGLAPTHSGRRLRLTCEWMPNPTAQQRLAPASRGRSACVSLHRSRTAPARHARG